MKNCNSLVAGILIIGGIHIESLAIVRAEIAPEIAKTYPDFAERVFG